jgi:hypothetical protein
MSIILCTVTVICYTFFALLFVQTVVAEENFYIGGLFFKLGVSKMYLFIPCQILSHTSSSEKHLPKNTSLLL